METIAYEDFRAAVQEHCPHFAVVLGSGLANVPTPWKPLATVRFEQVPGFVATTVAGHSGRISLGEWGRQMVVVFHGRLHFYEGHTWERVGAPMRWSAQMGIRSVILTNAAGGIREDLAPGSLMPIRAHRRLLWRGDWKHWIDEPPLAPYSARLTWLLSQHCNTPPGVYAALTGPSYETPAEIRALRHCGADAVGMSTAIEAETAHAANLEVAALSCITNRAAGLSRESLHHQEVLTNAATMAERLGQLLDRVIYLASLDSPFNPPR